MVFFLTQKHKSHNSIIAIVWAVIATVLWVTTHVAHMVRATIPIIAMPEVVIFTMPVFNQIAVFAFA